MTSKEDHPKWIAVDFAAAHRILHRYEACRGNPRQRGRLIALIVDASVIAAAERLATNDIATLDRRHFTVVQSNIGILNLLP